LFCEHDETDFLLMILAWVNLPMNVPQILSDLVFDGPTVPTLFGTPPQVINSTLDLNTDKLAVYSSDCVLCAGNTSFDVSMSSTAKVRFFLMPHN
jgi:hypothetical protein